MEILQRVLRDHDVSQAAFADEAGIAPATVNRWLNRRTQLTERKLAEALVEVGIAPESYGLRVPGLPGRAEIAVLEQPTSIATGEFASLVAQIAAAEERSRQRHEEVMQALRDLTVEIKAQR